MKLIEDINEKLTPALSAMDEFDWNRKEAYAQWLAQTYYFVRHSTRLLALSASRFSVEQNALHLRFIEHIREERGHEILALNDLKALGCHISSFPELSETSAFYQSQYYMIEYKHPTALFGYIMTLEILAKTKGPPVYQKVKNNFGKEASTFLKVHSEEDEGHVEKGMEQLEKLTKAELELVIHNLVQSSDIYRLILQRVATAQSVRNRAA